jgi:hypothetical protein
MKRLFTPEVLQELAATAPNLEVRAAARAYLDKHPPAPTAP